MFQRNFSLPLSASGAAVKSAPAVIKVVICSGLPIFETLNQLAQD